MTNKEKYLEEAINRIKYYNTDEPLKIVKVPFYDLEINALCDYFKQPTLSECIKEWEDKGYEWKIDKENKSLIILWNIQKLSRFEIDLKYKRVKCNHQIPSLIIYDINRSFAYVDFEEFHLLSKTLKALEEMKDE